MGNKTVTIETSSERGIAGIINAGFLTRQFAQVAPSVKYKMSGNAENFYFGVSFSREDFLKLAEKNFVSPDVVAAFQAADDLVMETDRERAGFWAGAWDFMRYRDTIMGNHPVVMSSQKVKGLFEARVCVKRYGVSDYKIQ